MIRFNRNDSLNSDLLPPKNGFIKVKMPIKGKTQLNLIEKDEFLLLLLTDHTEYEEYQKL